MEISNTGVTNHFAQAGKTAASPSDKSEETSHNFKALAADPVKYAAYIEKRDRIERVIAETNAKTASATPSVPKAPLSSVEKEATKWESFAEERVSLLNRNIDMLNDLHENGENRLAEILEESGPERAAEVRESREKMSKGLKAGIEKWSNELSYNFDVSGTIVENNADDTFKLGEFSLSKEGLGYEFFMNSSGNSEITYGRGQSYKAIGPFNKLDNDLQSLLFKENHR